jgi:hypothetical protein
MFLPFMERCGFPRAGAARAEYTALLEKAMASDWEDASVELEKARKTHSITMEKHFELMALVTGEPVEYLMQMEIGDVGAEPTRAAAAAAASEPTGSCDSAS